MNAAVARIAASLPVVPLTEAVELNPKPERRSLSDDLEVSFVPMAAVGAATGRMDPSTVRRYGDVKKGYTFFREADVLFAKITPCMENGKMAVARGLRNGIGCGSTEFHVLRPRPGVDSHYVYHFVSSARFRAEAAHHMTGAVGQKRVPASFLEQSQLPLPDLDEQRRIVAEIEKQFSRLDEAVANLKRAKANLKRYKAAVLKAAVEGRLVPTEAELARRDGRGYETGTELLRRIFEVRHSQWNGRGKYKEPDPPDMRDLPQLSEGWAWATVEMVCTRIVDCPHSTPRFHTSGHPCIDTTWMTPDGLAAERARFVDGPTYRERVARLEPCPGDVVFAREGTIGTAVVVPPRMQPCLGQRVMLLRSAAFFSNALLVHILHSDLIKSQYRAQALGSTVPHINVGDVKRFAVPVPPSGEQERLVAEVDRQLSLVREVEGAVDQNLERASTFRQVALANAFSTSVFA